MDLEAELDRLYGVPLDRFTEERNAIARAAKKAGNEEAAGAIKTLKKPSVGAWTINQLVRRHPDAIGDLLRVRDELEDAGSPQKLRELSGRRREIVARLASLARSILEGSDHGASHQTVEKVSQGLLAGGTEEERPLLEKGRLFREPTASGLEAFGMTPATELEEEPETKIPLKKQREIQRLRRDAESLQQEAARLEQEASFAEEQARRARAKAEEASQAADGARERAEAAAVDAGL